MKGGMSSCSHRQEGDYDFEIFRACVSVSIPKANSTNAPARIKTVSAFSIAISSFEVISLLSLRCSRIRSPLEKDGKTYLL
jgi:hypothetical protein